MKVSKKLLTGTLAALALTATGLSTVNAQPNNLTFVTSNSGGSFFPIGTAISRVLTENGITTSAEPGGGNSNPLSVSQGSADLGFTFAPTFAMATQGQEPFPEPLENIRVLGAFYMNTTQIAVTEESGVTRIEDLRGQPFASQGLSAASATFFRIALEAHGLSEDDLDIVVRGGPTQGANAVRDRNSIGFQATSAIPNGAMSEAFQTIDMRFLPISDEAFEKIVEINPAFIRGEIPAGAYNGVDEPVESISTPAVIVVNTDMPDDHAYQIVKILAENTSSLNGMHAALRDLTPELMASVSGIPLHPGAERYYKEMGLRD